MDNLRLILIIVALLAIVALLIHGFWINKKERSAMFTEHSPKPSASRDPIDLSWQNREQQTPSLQLDDLADEPELNLVVDEDDEADSPQQCDLFTTAAESKTDEGNATVETAQPVEATAKSDKPSSVNSLTPEKEVIILHVTGLYDNPLNGDSLLNSILQTGFQYGEMEIFHRYVDPAGNGPVLFSLANMVKPGTLNPETMPETTIPGISLFMIVPSFGDNLQNFKMMLQSAQRIAADIEGKVLDEDHHMLTPEKIAEYKSRIKRVVELHTQQD